MSIERQAGKRPQEKLPASKNAPEAITIHTDGQLASCLDQLEKKIGLAWAQSNDQWSSLLEEVQRAKEQVGGVVVFRQREKREEEELPLLRINTNGRQAVFDGKPLYFRKNHASAFNLLVFLAQNPNRNIPTWEIRKDVFPQQRREDVSKQVRCLRKVMTGDRNDSRIIVHSGGRTRSSSYRFKARVEFTNNFDRAEFPEIRQRAEGKSTKLSLGRETQIKTAYALFTLNDGRNGLKHSSEKDVFETAYPNTSQNKSRKTDLKYRNRKRISEILGKIKEAWSSDPDSLTFELGKFMRWLKSQPEYANAQFEDLAGLAMRGISFDEFLEKTGFSKKTPVAIAVELQTPASAFNLFPEQLVQEELIADHDLEIGQGFVSKDGNDRDVPFSGPPAVPQEMIPQPIRKIPAAQAPQGGIIFEPQRPNAETTPKPEEMILTNAELFTLFLCFKKETINGVFLVQGGVLMPSDLGGNADEMLTEIYSGKNGQNNKDNLTIQQSALDSLRRKMQMFAQNQDAFIKTQNSDKVKKLLCCLKVVPTPKLPDFVKVFIPQDARSLNSSKQFRVEF